MNGILGMTSIIVLTCLSDQKCAVPGEIRVYLSYILFIYTCFGFFWSGFLCSNIFQAACHSYQNWFRLKARSCNHSDSPCYSFPVSPEFMSLCHGPVGSFVFKQIEFGYAESK